VSAVCVYPGLVATGLLRERWWWRTRWLRWLWHQIFLTPREAARAVVRAATAPAKGVTGMCFARDGRLVRSSRRSYDDEARERLWKLSVEVTRAYLTNGG
jgi:hypothetical protein